MAMGRLILLGSAIFCVGCTRMCSSFATEKTGKDERRGHEVTSAPQQKVEKVSEKDHQAGSYWPISVGAPPTVQASPGPNYRDYYNPVFLELMDLPSESDRALSEALRGKVREIPLGATQFIPLPTDEPGLNSFGFSGYVSKAFWPIKPPIYVAFEDEGSCCDVIRGRYVLPMYVVDVASSRHVVMVRVTGLGESSDPPADQVTEFAKIFFSTSARDLAGTEIEFHWLQINSASGQDSSDPAYGCHDISKRKYSEHDHWVDKMNWWLRPGEIGFISTKGEGVMTRNFPNISVEYNKDWFKHSY